MMNSIAKVVVEISLNQEFDYQIPSHLKSSIRIGSQVFVPFNGRDLQGFVVGLANKSSFSKNLKEIHNVVGDKPFIPDDVVKLAYWIADYYCAPIENAVRAVLPSVIRRKGIAPKKQLKVSLIDITANNFSQKQKKIIDILKSKESLLLSTLKDLSGCSESPIRTLEKKGVLKVEQAQIRRNPHFFSNIVPSLPFRLTAEQSKALNCIIKEFNQGKSSVVLLQGVTGSGKTEVYLQTIQHVLKKNQGAIILVPEIALTPQTVERFRARFGEIVAVLHSSLSDGERHDEWHRIHTGESKIVVGARSALFAPIHNLGIIIVDEEHEPTYKQEESPRYHARDVAVMRGQFENCCVVLGSATPSLESINNVKLGRYKMAYMKKRVDNRKMPLINIINMNHSVENTGYATLFSRELIQAMYDRLNRGEQIILFLNRRGFSSFIICEKCGYVNYCEKCSVTKNYHKKVNKLICHICGSEEPLPSHCPECNDPDFRFKGSGTEKIEEIIKKICPHARIDRMDSDTMRMKDSYQNVLNKFRSGKTDILLGTQMIAKGLDFPNVTLVGVLNADISLYVPDFRAGERTYQLLTQVAGRAGRGDVSGEVIIQTYAPKHPAIEAAKKLDASLYAINDLAFRKEMMYPPFAHLVVVTFKAQDEDDLIKHIKVFFHQLKLILPDTVLLSPPLPAPLSRIKGFFRYQIILRSKHTIKMTKPIQHLLSKIRFPNTIKVIIDVDAVSLT